MERRWKVILGLIFLTVLLSACGKNVEEKWQEQYDLGMRHLEEQNYEEAIVAFSAAIEIEPKKLDAYIYRGQSYILSGETDENLSLALADYQKVLKLDETNVTAYLGVADVYIRQGDYEAVLKILNEGLEKTGGNEEIAAKITEIESGSIIDSNGNIRRRNCYDPSGNLIWYHEFTYDEKGRRTSVTSYDSERNQTGHLDITYQNNLPSAGFSYGIDDGSIDKQIYTYDDVGNVIRMDEYREDTLSRYFIYEYDTNGNCERKETYSANGYLTEMSIQQFNEQGKRVKCEDYRDLDLDGNLELSGCHIDEYDSNGNHTKYSHYDKNGELLGYRTWEYDSDRTTERYYNSEGQLESLTLYQYDEDGTYLGSERYDGNGNLVQTEIGK